MRARRRLKYELANTEHTRCWVECPKREYMMMPEVNLPKPPAIAGDGHTWHLQNYAHVFWIIPRDDEEDKWNCELFHTEVTQAHAVPKIDKAAVARAFNVSVPMMRNVRAIKKHEAIVLKWPKPKQPPKKPPRGKTWLSSQALPKKKPKIS